jgi:hypothetical protein
LPSLDGSVEIFVTLLPIEAETPGVTVTSHNLREGDMRNGLYKVTFETPIGFGAGVVVLSDGRLLGGDSSISYVGSYRQDGTTLSASVDTTMHTSVPGMFNVLGTPNAKVSLSGTVSGDRVQMTGSSPNAPGISLQATLQFLSA